MIEEKVMYAELRAMMLDKSIPSDDGTCEIDNSQQMALLLEAVKAKLAQLESDQRLHRFPFGVKIIYCTPRSISKSAMKIELQHCLELKIQFPDLICGALDPPSKL